MAGPADVPPRIPGRPGGEISREKTRIEGRYKPNGESSRVIPHPISKSTPRRTTGPSLKLPWEYLVVDAFDQVLDVAFRQVGVALHHLKRLMPKDFGDLDEAGAVHGEIARR